MGSNTRLRVFVILAFITAGGVLYFAYQKMQANVNQLVTTVQENSRPDLNILRIKELWSVINNAESNVRAYTVTHDENYLAKFLSAKDHLKAGIDTLKQNALLNGGDTTLLGEISSLIQQKTTIYDSLLDISYNRIISQALDQMGTQEVQSDTVGFISEEGNMFQRLFSSRYSRRSMKEKADSLLLERNNKIREYNKNIQKIKEEEAIKIQEQSNRELQLIEADKKINALIEEKINNLESQEQQRIESKAKASGNAAAEAALNIKYLVTGGLILIILLFLLVLRDLEVSNKRRKELLAARNKAEKLARAKEDFMSTMSHEIRTPLTSIIGYAGKLYQTKLDPAQLKYMNAITGSSDHLLSIVNDVLDYTRVDSGKLKFESIPFKAADIFTEVFDALIWKSEEKGIDLNLYIQPIATLVLHGDPVRLRQILFNIAGNAIKFTDTGSVDINATFLDEIGKPVLLIKISDTGIGIPNDKLKGIFDEFEQAEASTERKYGGSGLGLAITKKIVEQQGGSIKAESTPGIGSVFTIRLPFTYGALEERESSYSDEPPTEPFKGLTFLLAEDDQMIRDLQQHSLESLGADVLVAEDGAEALELYSKNKVDLILIDIQMPEFTGPEVINKIRNSFPEEKRNVPAIAMTANVLQHDVKKWLDEGMNDFVTKPFKEEELVDKINRLLQLRTTEDSGNKIPHMSETVTSSSVTPEQKLYDLQEVIEASKGNNDFVKKMINLFLTSSFASINNLKFHLKQQNWEQLGKTAHRMIGSYKQMGVDSAAVCLKELELISDTSRELGKAAYLVNEVEKISDSVFKELKNELQAFS